MKRYGKFLISIFIMLGAVFFVCNIKPDSVQAETSTHTVTFDFNIDRIKGYIPSNNTQLISSFKTYSIEVQNANTAVDIKDHYGINLYYTYVWTVEGKAVNLNSYSILKDTTFVAVWTPVEYKVKFTFPSSEAKSQVTNLQSEIKFTIESDRIDFYRPIRPHYAFDGWYMAGDMTEWLYLPAGSVGDKILVARFTPVTYSINYNTEPSGVLTSRTYDVEDRDISLVEATKKGHIFHGWFLDKDFKNPITKIDCSKGGNITLYPKWELEKYNVTYILPDGTEQLVEAEYGKTAERPTVEKNFLQIIITDVSRKNITEDTVIHVKLVNIWWVYLIGLILIVAIITLIIYKAIKKKTNHKTLRTFYHSNARKKRKY